MKRILLCLLCLQLVLCPVLSCLGDDMPSEMSLLAINVRKADALLLRCGDTAYLVDTGSKDSFDQLYAVLKAEGISRLTAVILTHTHKDHIGGLKQLLNSDIEVGEIYTSVWFEENKKGQHPAAKALKGTGKELSFLSGGDELPFSGASLKVLGPLEEAEVENNNSLVLLAECGGSSILLAGDMEFPEEASLLKAGVIPAADVLKIGNHGEGDATSAQLVATVRPKLAVISTTSDDEPDTPDPRVIRLLKDQGIPYLVTEDTANGILVTLKGGEILTEMK